MVCLPLYTRIDTQACIGMMKTGHYLESNEFNCHQHLRGDIFTKQLRGHID